MRMEYKTFFGLFNFIVMVYLKQHDYAVENLSLNMIKVYYYSREGVLLQPS
jgi:hypothetical protein